MIASQFTLEVMVGGLRRACERYESSIKSKGQREEAFCSLFEALNWAVVVQDRFEEERGVDWVKTLGGGTGPSDYLSAMRFARNRVHHHWPDALVLDERGAAFPMRFPIVFFEWRWRETLPPQPNARASDRGRTQYASRLAGQPARISLVYMVNLALAGLGEMNIAESHWA